jgi:multiple sugar transport system ATP-binding protein
MARVVFENVRKEYEDHKRGRFTAVKGSTFTIEDQEFVVFVGPSGCGKTTSLRMIAGLERQTSGNILIGDKLVNDLHPKERDIAMVFQDYALYPHMTIKENLSFGLRNLKQPKDVIEQKVREAAEMLGLQDLLDRKPKELSGGQRQRVALGRAIVRNPSVFLFDEPLSNLDAKLRVQMRVELAELHKRLKATIVYVTHDQVEAMTLGQRIVVMNEGVIQQMDTPERIYQKPANLFVAGFIGSPAMNLIPGVLADGVVALGGMAARLTPEMQNQTAAYSGREVVFGIRPEDILDPELAGLSAEQKARMNRLTVTVEVVEYLGSENLLYFKVGGTRVTAKVGAASSIRAGQDVELFFDPAKVHLFEKEEGRRITD